MHITSTEALGEVITEEVYNLLEEKCGLKRAPVPDNAQGDEPETFIFKSADLMTNEDKLMVLIHGSGVVRAGQWARRLIINDCLESGTQIPYIKRALSEGYAVLVMNTNDNYRTYKNGERRIRGSESPEAHATYVWNHYVRNTKAKHIAIVAHSYGGCVTTDLFRRFQRDFQSRVFAVAMTDSVHYISYPKEFRNLIKISRNWVRSKFPLDTELETVGYDVEQVSSGELKDCHLCVSSPRGTPPTSVVSPRVLAALSQFTRT
ncbi:cotranscriptional regulator FAM172A-like [Penaeus japonicus]|uniref:cotranscriptional regulator FAM172A-like n=1 Tax=Penaeus japonicus TaxID=27405 RepID=UPI001C70DE57|nr:cotranscriptional regulator FAM172A-like [Penaeus japonicus]